LLKDKQTNGFLWHGFGENIRVKDWAFRRLTNDSSQQASALQRPIGFLPDQTNSNGNGNPALLEVSNDFWHDVCNPIVYTFANRPIIFLFLFEYIFLP
jgi:GTP-dependent phosphoenolpyruvate carboxykinase